MRRLKVFRFDSMGYEAACEFQRGCVEAVCRSGDDEGMLILLEHPPVITIGRSGTDGNIVASPKELAEAGVSVHETSRGGDVTYHGPGQIVGYPIVPLAYHGKDVHRYLRTLEAVLIAVLEDYDIRSFRREGLTGVWTAAGKIAAIGVAVRHWITYHGFALNVSPTMAHFGLIHPCGMREVTVVSMRDALGRAPARAEVEAGIVRHFCEGFGFTETVRNGARCEAER